MKGEVHVRKDPISINLLFFPPFFFRSVCLFVCVPERVELKEAGKNKQTKQKNDDGDNNWPGSWPGVLSAYTYLTLLTMKKKMAIKDFLILFCTIIFLVTLGGKCVAKKEDNCFDIKVVTD